MRVVVAGAGVFGASIAFVLAKAGARVTLVDPAPIGANASGVAAGMLAPVFESLFEDGPECFARLIDARDDWPAFAAATAISINKPGALAVTRDKATLADWVARLGKIGASFVIRSQAEVARTRPDLAEGLFGVETWDDWRLEAQAALNALLSAVKAAGADLRQTSVTDFTAGEATLGDGSSLEADALVIATGANAGLVRLAPELADLMPIKGHILEVIGAKVAPYVVRFEGGYICPTPTGCFVGATMEQGRSDVSIEPEKVELLRENAARYAPVLRTESFVARAGVRAATVTGWPLIGKSGTPGVWLAVGARRNGWLLAPRIAQDLGRQLLG